MQFNYSAAVRLIKPPIPDAFMDDEQYEASQSKEGTI